MQYLLKKALVQGLEEKFKNAQRIFLFLDYDGTLTSIKKTPDLALLSSSVRRILLDLSLLPQMILTIISGRSLNRIQKLIGVESINYVGNHGLEMKVGASEDEIPQHRKIRKRMAWLSRKINAKIGYLPGILVENKGLTLSVHYRLVQENRVPELKKMVSAIIYPFKRSYELREGKKVLEIRPKSIRNKGWAVKNIIRKYGSVNKSRDQYLYIGDDLTDEDAFKLTNSKGGYSILVDSGSKNSKANYYLKSTKEVRLFLIWLKKSLTRKERGKL
jgi:trehalose 6-phosphate phosphatase